MGQEKPGGGSPTLPPRFRVLSDPYGTVALIDEGKRDYSPSSREEALILALNRLASELAELKAKIEPKALDPKKEYDWRVDK